MMKVSDFFSPQGYPYIRIKEKALENNLTQIEKLTHGKSKILIPVKANAYGCGVKEILPFLKKATDAGRVYMLGVANVSEAKFLRAQAWQNSILLLGGFFEEQIKDILQHRITVAITSPWQIQALQKAQEKYKTDKKAEVHLKWDVGMGRIGLTPLQQDEIVLALQQASLVKVSGMFCHFPCADEKANSATLHQFNSFLRLSENILQKLRLPRHELLLHTANSYATFHFPQTHLDMVRCGLFFYGYFQNADDKKRYGRELPLEPALELRAAPISLRKLTKGDTVSYGSNYRVQQQELSVGVFPLGYADGISRKLSGKISFDGHLLIGNVTMDQILLENISEKEEIVLLGEGSEPLEEWADINDTISYEILTGFGMRLKRILT